MNQNYRQYILLALLCLGTSTHCFGEITADAPQNQSLADKVNEWQTLFESMLKKEAHAQQQALDAVEKKKRQLEEDLQRKKDDRTEESGEAKSAHWTLGEQTKTQMAQEKARLQQGMDAFAKEEKVLIAEIEKLEKSRDKVEAELRKIPDLKNSLAELKATLTGENHDATGSIQSEIDKIDAALRDQEALSEQGVDGYHELAHKIDGPQVQPEATLEKPVESATPASLPDPGLGPVDDPSELPVPESVAEVSTDRMPEELPEPTAIESESGSFSTPETGAHELDQPTVIQGTVHKSGEESLGLADDPADNLVDSGDAQPATDEPSGSSGSPDEELEEISLEPSPEVVTPYYEPGEQKSKKKKKKPGFISRLFGRRKRGK